MILSRTLPPAPPAGAAARAGSSQARAIRNTVSIGRCRPDGGVCMRRGQGRATGRQAPVVTHQTPGVTCAGEDPSPL